jgi:hypothetical protein
MQETSNFNKTAFLVHCGSQGYHKSGRRDRMVVGFMQSVHITTNVVSSNPV